MDDDIVVPPDSSRELREVVRQSSSGRLRYLELLAWDDLSLMRAVQVQNGDALAVLFDRYCSLVLGVALKILHDHAESEEVLQAIFLEIYQKAGQFDPAKGRFYTWLMQYAYHRSINRRNYLIVRQFYGTIPVERLMELDQGAHEPYSQSTQECHRFVHQALAMLSEGQKCTIEMVHFEGLTLKEVATRIAESFFKVRHYYYRSLAKLKNHLKSVRHDEGRG